MAQVLPAERDLRRVIGDGDAVPDGEVEGLADHDLIELLPRPRPAADVRRALRGLPPRAIGLLRRMPAATVLSWWRGHPAGWWNPADYNVASICVPIATHVPHAAGLPGEEASRRAGLRDRVLRGRGNRGGLLPRGRELRRGDARSVEFRNEIGLRRASEGASLAGEALR